MTDRALSEASMLASLRDIHLPAEAAGGLGADIAMTIGLAGLLALVVAGGLRLLSLRRRPGARPGLHDHLALARALPEAERRVMLLHLLRDRAPDRYAALARDLYRPGAALPVAQLETELERLV